MKTLFPILQILITSAVTAQVFPLQVSIQLTPPYTPYLTDYTVPGSENFAVQISLNDLTITDYHCKLRLKIEGVGIELRSRENYAFAPLVLQGSQIFYGSDLYEYFRPESLEFKGMSPADRLPEGVYRFSVEVLDYNRGTAVSNRGTATAWIVLNDPPMLNTPFNLTTVRLQDPPNILFSWTPRHAGSPNAAFSTEYTFRLMELWPENRNPYDAFLTQKPLVELTTADNHLLYGAAEPQLLPGRRYAWQIHARDQDGKDLFKNEGRSEVFIFQYGDALAIPDNLRMRWAKPTTLAIQWDAITTTEDVRYRLQYRPRRRTDNHEWYETWTRFTEKTFYHLQTNTEYEMRIRSENALQESDYSESRVFKTLPEESSEFACRDDTEPPPLPENTLPLFPLSINDTIHAGGYDVLVRDVMKDGSRYYGSGLAIVPWLNSAKVRVTFEKIAVNDRFWLTSGTITSVWDGSGSFHIEHQTPVAPGKVPQAGNIDITIVSADSLISIEGSAIAAVTKDEQGNIVVTTTDGKEQVINKGESVAIVDAVGNGYVVDKEGNVVKTTAHEAMLAADRGSVVYDLRLQFEAGPARFGFDKKKYEPLGHLYQQLDDGTYVAWKALSSAAPDGLEAIVTSPATEAHRLMFESAGDRLMPVSQNGNVLALRVQGKVAGIEDELLALYGTADTIPPRVVGKINLATYNPAFYNLQIIPVNGAALPGELDAKAISDRLNSIYSQAVVAWSVTVRENLEVALGQTFDDGEAGVFSNYTEDMKKVLQGFGPMDENTWYLFIIETPRNLSTLGYMPRNRRAGFVFSGPHEGDSEKFLKTIAHELGHGAFNLKHTFSEYNLPVGGTDNLMDYGDGTALYKYQWDHIHEPAAIAALFEGGDAGSLKNELSTFYEEAAPLLKEPGYYELAEKVRKVYEFLQACQGEGWESYNGQGIVPYCFWRDQDLAPILRYTIADLAFTAGFIDGGYNEVEGIYNLPDVVREVAGFPGKLLYAYTLAYWECRSSKLLASVEEYEYVIDELARAERESGLWSWIRKQWNDYEGDKEALENYFKDCREADDLREAIEDLYELAVNWEQVKELSEDVFTSLKVYWDTLKTSTNQGRYEVGALVIPTASLFLPLGVGFGSKAERLKGVIRLLRQVSKEDLGNVARKIGQALWVRGGKVPSVADEAATVPISERVLNIIGDLPPPVGKFRALTGKSNRSYKAEEFWSQQDPSFKVIQSADLKYLVKHDPATGRILFGDVSNKRFLSFAIDEDQLIGDNYEKLFKSLQTVHGLPGGARTIHIRGTTIHVSGEKANAFLGKYDPNSVPGISGEIGIDDVINELSILKNYSFADEAFELHPGSVHVLNIPQQMADDASDFFNQYNRPFLDMLIRNKERVNIVFVTDPKKAELFRKFENNIPTDKPTGLAMEVRYLREHNFNIVLSKDGTVINLDDIDLDFLDWQQWKY